MIVNTSKYLFKKITSKGLGKVARWGFVSVLAFFGPGAVVGVVGLEGLIITGIVTHSGLIEYTTEKLIS